VADIFLSYANEDVEHARVLAEALQRVGWSVWWDHHIPPGKSWAEVIEREIMSAGCVIVLWSQHAVRSQWVQNEAREGLSRHVLVPVVGEDGVRLPLEFRHVQVAYLHDWDPEDDRSEYPQLVASIRDVLRRGTAIPEPSPQPAPPPRRHRVRTWPWIAGIVAAALLIGLWLLPKNDSPQSVPVDTVSTTAVPAPATDTTPTAPPPQTDTATTWPPTRIPRPEPKVAIGTLVGGKEGCVAFLVARDLALTDTDCITGTRLMLSFRTKRYAVTVAEKQPTYALLRLQSPADRIYPVVSLETRSPKTDETVRVLTAGGSTSCTALSPGALFYECRTAALAPGSPVIGEDGLLLGMHRRPRTRTVMDGIKLSSILRSSDAL
jgi:TIR domain